MAAIKLMLQLYEIHVLVCYVKVLVLTADRDSLGLDLEIQVTRSWSCAVLTGLDMKSGEYETKMHSFEESM